LLGRELEDAEHHLRDHLVGYFPDVPGGEEPALPEAGLLRAHHVLEHRLDGDVLTWPEVAVIGLIAVGGHDGGEAGLVEDLGHPAQRIVGLPLGMQPAHGPHLGHRRGSHDAGMTSRDRRILIHVDRVRIADGLHPGVDHRLIHRVPPPARRTRPGRPDLRRGAQDVLVHLGT